MNIRIPNYEANIVLLLSMTFIVASILLSIPLYIGFFAGILLTSVILIRNGSSLVEVGRTLFNSLKEAKMLYIVILLIGATTTVWMASGVVPAMMYYGFSYLDGVNFLLAAFIIIALVSVFMGTAVGTISTIGIALLGIGRGFGIPSELVLGVIVSGAFIADKISPISGLLNLTLTTVNKSYREVLKAMLPTLIPTLFLSALIYYILGRGYASTDSSLLLKYQASLREGFEVSPYLLLLPLAVFAASLLGLKTVATISLGALGGAVFGIAFQGASITQMLGWMIFGYKGNTPSAELNGMLVSGGMVAMLEVLLIVMGAVALVGLFESSGMITPIIERFMKDSDTRSKLILKTGIISGLLTVVTCDQTIGILLPGKLLQGRYKDMKLDASILARTISDTGTIIAPLMAWNVNALIILSITGVPAQSYFIYAVLCYIAPVVTAAAAYLFRNKSRYLQ